MTTLALLCALATGAAPSIFADDRDLWTFLDPHLRNRNLFTQIRAPEQAFRLGRDLDWLALAADTSIATQQSIGEAGQSRFHGFFVFDGFLALRPLDFVEVDLNLVMLNPSASDGFRISSQINAGVTLHLHYDAWTIAGEQLELDALGIDLGPTTIGQGLLLEQFPLEGEILGVAWNGFYLRHVFGGRVFWFEDDLISFALGAFDGRVELDFVRWQFPGTDAVNPAAHYLTLALDWPLTPWARIAAEYGARLRDTLETAGLARFDLMFGDVWGAGFHAGYQARYYGRAFGPRTDPQSPTMVFNVPAREDAYVTNPFEFFGISPFFDQFSHTVMAEARVPLFDHLFAYGTLEIIVRNLVDTDDLGIVAYVQDHRGPGRWIEGYYRVGLELRPWMTLPHRINAFVTNKQVRSSTFVTDPVASRFVRADYVVIEAEVFL